MAEASSVLPRNCRIPIATGRYRSPRFLPAGCGSPVASGVGYRLPAVAAVCRPFTRASRILLLAASVVIDGVVYCLCFDPHHSITFKNRVTEQDLISTFDLETEAWGPSRYGGAPITFPDDAGVMYVLPPRSS